MGRNLSNLFISQSYQFITQISGSELQDGLGNTINNLTLTASFATSASNAIASQTAGTAISATSASYAFFATTASFALNGGGGTVNTGSLLVTASAAQNVVTFTKGDGSTFPVTVATGSATTVNTGSLMVTGSATSNVLTFTKGDGSTFNLTVATGSAVTVNTGSLMVTGSVSSNTLTFTKGDGSTFNLTVATGSAASAFPYTGSALITGSLGVTGSVGISGSLSVSGSIGGNLVGNNTDTFTGSQPVRQIVTLTQAQYNGITPDANTFYIISDSIPYSSGSFLVTSSISNATITFTKGDGTTYTNVVNNVVSANSASVATSASFATTAVSSSFATSASFATTASFALNVTPINTGSFYVSSSVNNATITFNQGDGTTEAVTVNNVANATSASFAATASIATSSSYALSASNATVAGTASFIPSNVNLNVASISASSAVFQSASIGFLTTITGSVVNIGDAFVVLNTSNATRYAGIKVEDSGSATPQNYTASLQFDSQTNDWFYEYTSSADPDNFGVVMFGPEYNTKGSPTYLTNNKLSKGNGGHHLNDSTITDNGTNVVFTTPISGTTISASVAFAGDLVGTATQALVAFNAVTSSYAATASIANTATSASYAVSASQAQNAVTASFALNVTPLNTGSFLVTASVSNATITYTKGDGTTFTNIVNNVANATSASLAANATSASFATTSVSSSFATSASFATTASFASSSPTPTLQQVTTAGATTNVAVTINNTASADYWLVDTKPFAQLSTNTIIAGRIDGADEDFILAGRNYAGGTANAITMTDGEFIYNQTNHIFTGSINSDGPLTVNDAVVISGSINVSGSVGSSNLISNNTDTFAGSAKVYEIVTCTQAEYITVSGSVNAANTLYVITDNTGSGAYIEGAVQGNVQALTITSNTASLDCDAANFFTLTLVSGSNTLINPTNINSGQTINLRITQANPGNGTVTFPSSVKQVSGSAYVPTAGAGPVDIVTFIAFDTASLYLSNVKNLV